MIMDYDNTNKGALWKADKASDKHPDHTGAVNVDGTDYFISMWKNSSDNIAAPSFRISVKKKEEIARSVIEDEMPF